VITSVLASRPELPAGAPPELARICARAMHADPEQRFESADALRLALQHYLEHRGSELLAKRATERLEELRAQLAAGAEQTADAHDDIYRLFGACRYGFRDALAVWPENEEASRGLVEAIEAVAAYELANGRAQAAVSLLGELATPSPLLADARAAAAKQARRVEELERMEREHDTKIGSRTRTFLTALFGVAFTTVPIIFGAVPRLQHLSYELHFVWAGVFLVLLLGAAWWARESLQATHLNRQLTRSMWYLFLVQAAVAFGAWKLGRPTEELFSWNVVLYATFAGMFAISVDLYLLPAAAAYLLTFLLFAGETTRILYASAACNALICALGVWRWRPASMKYTDEERIARGKQPRQRSS
jgi:eukaryotic-like serine/threonine-protein kinase